ncbi:hypothetical protein [Agromyces sp. Marseille-P2726]|uniref:hypothetical protein n=1 Tax=Agromyces sp. Marseille-P2726 TaxID=2709132 RepID=UPI001570F6B8|nr:hypothetical protein [Agromyces sp. Marseille-P2726]
MSETDGSLDPRYDARFQRGYVGDTRSDAAADVSEGVETSGDALQPPHPDDEAPQPTPEPPGPASESESAEPTADPAEPWAVADPVPDSEPDLVPAPGVAADAALERGLRAPASVDSTRPDLWFLGAWGVALAALVIGAALYGSAIMAQDFFGPSDQSDRLLQLTGFTVGPALVQVGLLGIVGMLGWAGVRHARASARGPQAAGAVGEPPIAAGTTAEGERR